MRRSIQAQIRRHQTPPRFALLTAYDASHPGLDGSELDHLAPLVHLLRMLIKPTLVSVIGGPTATPAAVLARQFMTHNDLLSGVGDGAALEEAQLLMYPSGGSQERIERGSTPDPGRVRSRNDMRV